jgi:2-polyprenyl-6-methoxyphenol hydroxylase-like FAD-dependent oxidoreductase
MAPSQGLGANLGMVDGLQLAQYFAGLVTTPTQAEEQAQTLEAEISTRGRKAVLASRAAARRLHLTNRLQQGWRNVGFRTGNLFLQGFSRRQAPVEQAH